ncbi:MAG: DoxX family protein [Proteobacteria bacterium]|nr:MAG: DoxX family protein [Pseudomonadota bacterium]
MEKWYRFYHRFLSRTVTAEDSVLLFVRLTLGSLFIQSGWGKFQRLDGVVEYFNRLGIPAAQYQAPFVASVELIAGFFILFGVFAAVTALPLMVIMLVATLTARREEIDSLTAFNEISEFLYLLLLGIILVRGAGQFSVDGYFKTKLASKLVKAS